MHVARIDRNLAAELLEELRTMQAQLESVEKDTIVSLDLNDLYREVKFAQKVLIDRNNLA